MILVTGDAGIGKTRLLRELVAALRQDPGLEGVVAAWGCCIRPADVDIPLATPGDTGQPHPRLLRPAGPLGGSTCQRDPPRAGARAGGCLDAGQGRLRLLDAVHDVVRPLVDAGHSHPVLVIDNLHWADPATLDLVAILAPRLGRIGAMLVMACRREVLAGDSGLRSFLLDLERDWVAESVDLGPLDATQVGEQVAAIGAHGHDPALVAARSEGNPFVVEELLRLPLDQAALPDSLRELLRTAGRAGHGQLPCR